MGESISVTTENTAAIGIGDLVAYYRNGYRYGRVVAMTAKLAQIKPAGCGAALWLPLGEITLAI
jgi:hypothetical protein